MLKINTKLLNINDYEYQKIIKKLKSYGIKPTGNKTYDKTRLKEFELRELKNEKCISNKHLAITKAEQEKILFAEAEKKVENSPQQTLNRIDAEELLGQQILQAIELKQKKKIT